MVLSGKKKTYVLGLIAVKFAIEAFTKEKPVK